jgi:hypothetical protein
MQPADIARAVNAPLGNVEQGWPPLLAALDWQGINTHATRVAMAATVSVETGVTEDGKNMTFLPVREIGGQFARYAPWYGRGFIQCTWQDNYAHYGPLLDPPQNLLANPDILLQLVPSAQMAALFFKEHNIPALAAAGNWTGVRVAINGGTNGLAVFLQYVSALQAIPDVTAPPVTKIAISGALKTGPNHTCPGAVGPDHTKPVTPPVGTVVTFCPDPSPGQWHGKETTPNWAHIQLTGSPAHGWYLRADLATS